MPAVLVDQRRRVQRPAVGARLSLRDLGPGRLALLGGRVLGISLLSWRPALLGLGSLVLRVAAAHAVVNELWLLILHLALAHGGSTARGLDARQVLATWDWMPGIQKPGADAESQRACTGGRNIVTAVHSDACSNASRAARLLPQRNDPSCPRHWSAPFPSIFSVSSFIPARVSVLLFGEHEIFRPYSSTKPTASSFQ